MNLQQQALTSLIQQAQGKGIAYQTGPFTIRLQTNIPHLVETVQRIYPTCTRLDDEQLCQFHIHVPRQQSLLHALKPQAMFYIDGLSPFEPYPMEHAFPLYEWGLNWCIGTTANNYLLLHSAVVERNGLAIILPAMPGSGKSTLCAALIHRGWRLLSDEFGVIRHEDGQLIPLPRAIPLKNESIAVIKSFAENTNFGPYCPNTRKGNVQHLAPPPDSISRQGEPATPRWVIFPQYDLSGTGELIAEPKSLAFTRLSNNAFNYQISGERGFLSLARLIRSVDCYSFHYHDLDKATALLTDLADRTQA